MKRHSAPAPRAVPVPLRSPDTALATFDVFPGHRRRLTIDHRPLVGVTPEMLLWWFTHIGGSTLVDGEAVANYRLWHPLDHVRWSLARPGADGGPSEGARFHIVEVLQRRPEYTIDSVETVEKLDRTGIRLTTRLAGVVLLQLEHTWSRCEGHTHYVSVLDVGARSRALTPVNAFLRRRVLPDDMARAWVRHNIEEVGLLEQVIPAALAGAQPMAERS